MLIFSYFAKMKETGAIEIFENDCERANLHTPYEILDISVIYMQGSVQFQQKLFCSMQVNLRKHIV